MGKLVKANIYARKQAAKPNDNNVIGKSETMLNEYFTFRTLSKEEINERRCHAKQYLA